VRRLSPTVLVSVLALLIVPVVLAYSNIFEAEFTFDDGIDILRNVAITKLWPPSFLQAYQSEYEYLNHINFTRPVSQFTFALNYALGGFTPWGYHVVNLAIHACSTVLVFGILRRTLLTPLLAKTFGEAALGVALAGALLWGVHPLETNTVTYTSPRMEALMAMFYLLTLYSWVRGVQDRSRGWLVASVVASFLGMMSKEVMITAPVMVFLYDGLFLAGSWRQALRRRWGWYIGLALSAAWLIFLVLNVPGEHGDVLSYGTDANPRGAHSDRWSYAATMPDVILYYLRLIVWPHPLVFDYKWPVAASWMAVAIPGSVVAAAVLAAVWGFARRQAWAFPIAWYLITLLPSSSVLPLYDDYIAEYRVYLPSIGPIIFIACGAWLILRTFGMTPPRRAWVGALAGAALVCGLGGMTWARNVDYRTAVALWLDTVAKAPDNDRAHFALADALLKQGRYDEAIAQYREALRLYPGNTVARRDLAAAYNDRGVALAGQGRLAEALEEFREALRTRPDYGDAHDNVGVMLAQQGRFDQALPEFQEALRLNPDDNLAKNNLRELLGKQGLVKDTTQEFREALRLNPNDVSAAFKLANALADQGRYDEAIEAYRTVLRLDPRNSEAHNNLGTVYRKKGRLDDAVAEFQSALRLNPADALAAFNLGSLLDATGHLDEAAQALRMATRLAPQDVDGHMLLAGILFKQGKLAEATPEYREVARLKPTAAAFNNLAIVLSRQGDREGSLEALRQALAIDPNNPDARSSIRALQGGKGN